MQTEMLFYVNSTNQYRLRVFVSFCIVKKVFMNNGYIGIPINASTTLDLNIKNREMLGVVLSKKCFYNMLFFTPLQLFFLLIKVVIYTSFY